MGRSPIYSPEPADGRAFTEQFNNSYGRLAQAYDLAVKALPFWRRWIGRVIPLIEGPRVLETSCGTGWLLAQYAGRFQTCAIDLNEKMARIALKNVTRAGTLSYIQIADVAALPFPDDYFDSIVNTMAFSGYPHGRLALAEMRRVLRSEGKLILVDINYPNDGRWMGWQATRLWAAAGDIIRDMPRLLAGSGFHFTDEEIGGFGSVHLYVATKK